MSKREKDKDAIVRIKREDKKILHSCWKG